jgi:hypothetical protein
LSPDGAHTLFPQGGDFSAATTQVYSGNTLATAVPGVALAWIDNGHFLVQTYADSNGDVPGSAHVYDTSGAITSAATLAVSYGDRLVPVGGTLVYWRRNNQVLDYATGAVTYQGPYEYTGTPVGDYVMYFNGSENVYIDRFR